jgi:hypothetical protein
MKKRDFYKFLVLIVLLSGFSLNTIAQNISADAKLDSLTIRIGDQTKLRLVVRQPAKEKVNFPKLTDSIGSSKVQIVSSRMDTVADKSDKSQITVMQVYTITSFDQGTYTIPSYSIGSSAGVLATPQLTLMVQTIKVDTTKAIYDIKQPMAVSYTFWDWLKDHKWWVLLAAVVVAGAIVLIVYLSRPKPVKKVKVIAPDVPAHVIALNKLQQLRERKLWQQEAVKEYHSELSDIIREYLEKRYVIKTHERTTEEIISSLRHMSIANEYRVKLNQVLVLADLVKFAKEKPLPEDNELSMENAISFVTKTQETAQLPPQPAEGGGMDRV